MVYYRKYRPQTIGELDSAKLRETLYAVLASPSIPHAFLFTGPKGLGKTSTARIVAKTINCERLASRKIAASSKDEKLNAELEPCNACDSCTSITNGTNIDVLEIDGASNRGIDEIRDLREKIRLAPAVAKKKVYIIDEVHMLTTEAFNALLKTLEEPPSHAMLILCTTESYKVPETIVSRCFHVSFTLATEAELQHSFTRIAKGEGFTVDDGALQLLTTLADGSFRDGAKILEEVVLLSKGKQITKELIEEKFQISNIQLQISTMLGALQKKDAKVGIQLVAKLVEQGIDIKYFIEQTVTILHGLLLHKVGVGKEDPLIQDSGFRIQDIKTLIESFTKAHGEYKYAVLPQLPLEMAIIEWSGKNDAPASLSGNAGSNAAVLLRSPLLASPVNNIKKDEGQTSVTDSSILLQLIDTIKVQNQSIAGVLRGCKVKTYDGKTLVLEAAYKFHKDKLTDQKTLPILEQAVKDITGNSVSISVLLKSSA